MENRAIFLDRDGVINRNTHYVNKPEDFEILPLVPEAIKILKTVGFKIFVVTNQGGIEKGFIKEKSLQAIHKKMKEYIPEIDAIRYCASYNSFERKPNPGMLYDLAYDYEIYLSQSYMIGDMITDIIAGKRAGCITCFVMSNIIESMKHTGNPDIDIFGESLMDITTYILKREGFDI